MGWNQVRWTEARQIASLLGVEERSLPEASIAPEEHHRALRDRDERSGAVDFLGVALPRLEAIAWAAHVLEQEAAGVELPRGDRQALDHALRWLGDPSDANRRAAKDAADAASDTSAEKLLALSVFLSGGSISTPDLPPIPPAPELAGKLAANAITVAAYRGTDHAAVFDRALDLGERVAADGLKALALA